MTSPELAELKCMLSTNAMEGDDPETFYIQWNVFESIGDPLNVPKLHFAFQRHFQYENEFKTLPISWCGKPSCDMTKKLWNWGYIRFHSNHNLKEDDALVGSGGLSRRYTPCVIPDSTRCRLVAYIIK